MKAPGLRLDQAPPLEVPMRFFLTGPLFGVAAGLLLAAQGRSLLLSPFAPGTVALTHLVTLGWLSMVMLGAIYQIIPVLLGAVVPGIPFAKLVHLGLTLGVAALAGGLLLDSRPLLVAGGGLLGAAFLIAVVQFFLAFARARVTTITAVAIKLAVFSLAMAVGLGLVFVAEYSWGWLPISRTALTIFHVYLALGGWIGALICGVGYHVIPMFYLAGPFPPWRRRFVVGLLAFALATAPAVLFGTESRLWQLIPAVSGLAALSVFSGTVYLQLARRKRKIFDPTLRFWQTGLAAGMVAMFFLVGSILWPHPRWVMAFGGVYMVGFAGAIENGMTYKIVPFLVWLHRYSKLAANWKVPLMTDILSKRHAGLQWQVQLATVLVLAGALLYPVDALVRVAGVLLASNCGYWFFILCRAATHQAELVPLNRPEASPVPPPGGGPTDQ